MNAHGVKELPEYPRKNITQKDITRRRKDAESHRRFVNRTPLPVSFIVHREKDIRETRTQIITRRFLRLRDLAAPREVFNVWRCALVLIAICTMTAACLLGDDIETLRSKAGPVSVPGANLAAKLSWLRSNAHSGAHYSIELTANESIGPQELSYGDKITITLRGGGANRTVTLSSNGSPFTVSYGVTLILDTNITVQGRADNSSSLVSVNRGTLIMNDGSAVIGNGGCGVHVDYGTFTMNGGAIVGNSGGGVYVWGNSGTFTMNAGTISDNTVTGLGGGVCVSDNGTFAMSGGTISGNTASRGGGVEAAAGTFIKTGGAIYGYSADDMSNSNVVKDRYNGTVLNNQGHAVYAYYSSAAADTTKRKETTAGPDVYLYFNNGTSSGAWDY